MSAERQIASTSTISSGQQPRIFQDCKFFIQKDLTQQIQVDLCETIEALGGRVEAKVPRNGYILIQPGSAEAERLKVCWKTTDRPDRYFVPYTYIEACKLAEMLLEQIFTINGEPIKMHIHPSIANVNVRLALSQRIMHSGGDPTASAQNAKVILADPNTEVFQHLCKTYQNAEKHVESWLWVKKSVERQRVSFTPVAWKNPGGRRAGEERKHFTDEDEERLCHWIAIKIPYKANGGRTGNRLYQQLCDMSNDPAYAWVTRHTWQSWRERYKKNASRLDPIIASIVERTKIQPGEQGQYNFIRQPEPEESASFKAKKRLKKVPESEGEPVATNLPPPPLPPPPGGVVTMTMNLNEPIQPPLPNYEQAVMQHPTFSSIPDPFDENEDDWTIRIGNEPPPAWGSCSSTKRPRPSDDEYSIWKKARTTTLPELSEIATTFRFTVEEVGEIFVKYGGDADRTRKRIQEMRRLADTVPFDF